MEELTPQQIPEAQSKRPNMLTVLCILTFIGSGMQLLSSLIIAGFYDIFVQIAHDFAEKFHNPGFDQFSEVRPVFFLVSAILYAGSVAGAILMMNMKKSGFHVYTIFQILLIIATMYFMHLSRPDALEVLFSGLFIFLYSMNLKFMK